MCNLTLVLWENFIALTSIFFKNIFGMLLAHSTVQNEDAGGTNLKHLIFNDYPNLPSSLNQHVGTIPKAEKRTPVLIPVSISCSQEIDSLAEAYAGVSHQWEENPSFQIREVFYLLPIQREKSNCAFRSTSVSFIHISA